MTLRSPAAALLVVLSVLALPGFTVEEPADAAREAACAAGSPAAAATHLFGADAELVESDAGSALVLTPGVYPGVRNRLVAAGDSWCTAAAVNLTVADVLGSDAVTVASAAATYLPAAHFDEVTVTDAAEVAPGIVELTTHARTNGVVADWTVHVDALGVRSAMWRAIDFAVPPFEAQIEGLTALPGAQWTYTRTSAGLLESTTTIEELAARNEEGAPSPFISVETKDGFTIHVHETDAAFTPQVIDTVLGPDVPRVHTGVAPDAGMDTGVTQVDYLRIMGEAAKINADDFHDWGWRKGWIDDDGGIYVDGALSVYCIACVLVSEHFNVHMSRAVLEALGALGYSYPEGSERLALINVVGHEMVHNYQNAYGKPQSVGGGRHNSYSEGMARFSETLHSYSHISHQPGSLVYANDTNGCNGWQGSNPDGAFAAGPLTGQSYDACYFWMTVHAAHGIEAFVGILENSRGLPGGRPWEIYHEAIEAGTGAPLAETLANFAAMTLTGRNYSWGNPTDPESGPWDWAQYLDRWNPSAAMTVGETVSRTLRDGGMAAWRFNDRASVDISDGPGHAVAFVTDDGETTSVELLADGDVVEAPPAGSAWIVLINTGTESGAVSVTLAEPPPTEGEPEPLYLFDSDDNGAHARPGVPSEGGFAAAAYMMGPENGIAGSAENLGTIVHDWDANIDVAGLPGIVLPRGSFELAGVWHEQWPEATTLARNADLTLFVASASALGDAVPAGETLRIGVELERLRENENTVDASLLSRAPVEVPMTSGWARIDIPLDLGAQATFGAGQFLRLRVSCLATSDADCHVAYDNETLDSNLQVTVRR